ERIRLDIDEDRRRADRDHRAGARGEGEGGHEHGIAGANTHGHQRNHEGIAAARHADGVTHAGKLGKALFEKLDLRAEYELAVGKHGIHARLDLGFKAGALALQVEERNTATGRERQGLGRLRDIHQSITPVRICSALIAARIMSATLTASRPALPSTIAGRRLAMASRKLAISAARLSAGCKASVSGGLPSSVTVSVKAERSARSSRPSSATVSERSPDAATRLALRVAATPLAKMRRAP